MKAFVSKSISKFKEEMSENFNAQKGKIIKRYNIALERLEHYFIPSEHIEDYEHAHFNQDPEAHTRFGIFVKRAGF